MLRRKVPVRDIKLVKPDGKPDGKSDGKPEPVCNENLDCKTVVKPKLTKPVGKPAVKPAEKSPTKKKPGRPRKHPVRIDQERTGIATKPKREDHYMEFNYDKPLIFKKILQYIKGMKVSTLFMTFKKRYVTIQCIDHLKSNFILVKIDCSNASHYYCEGELEIELHSKHLENIASTIDTRYSNIAFLSPRDTMNSHINIVLRNDIGTDECRRVSLKKEENKRDSDIVEKDLLLNQVEFEDSNYTIQMTVPGRFLKKLISDVKLFATELSVVQEEPKGLISFEYMDEDSNIDSKHYIINNDNLKCKSELCDDAGFRTSFNIDYVKPLSSQMLSETLDWLLDEEKKMMFKIHLDEGKDRDVDFKILTKIIRPEDKVIS